MGIFSIANDVKQAASAVGDGAEDAAKTVGNGAENAAKKVSHGAEDAANAVGKGAKQTADGAGNSGTIADVAKRFVDAANFAQVSGDYTVPVPRIGDAAGAPKLVTPETSIETNARLHCVGNVASETVAGAFAGGASLGKLCSLFPLSAPFSPNCAGTGAALGGVAGANHAMQTPACQKTFSQQPPP